MKKTIIVTGTPATGKTTVAKEIAHKLGLKYIDINKIIDEHKLCEGYDEKRKCKIIDTDKLSKVLIKIIRDSEKKLVLDSHLSHFLPKENVEICIITKCNLKELKARLEKRGYSKNKVNENMDAEIFDVCKVEAEESGHAIVSVDTSKGSTDLDDMLKDRGYFKSFTKL